MTRELNKIFDAKTREARRRILDKFDISNEDKNEVLNKIENSDGGGDSSSVEYLDVSGMHNVTNTLLPYAFLGKFISSSIAMISPSYNLYRTIIEIGNTYSTLQIEIDFNFKVSMIDSGEKIEIPIKDILMISSFTQEELDAIPRITKEEFYSLETNTNTYTFTIQNGDSSDETFCPNQPYQFEEGMTWEQWVASDYNNTFNRTPNTTSENVILVRDEVADLSIRLNEAKIKWTDVIISTNYTFSIIA